MKLPESELQKNMTYPLPWQPYTNQTNVNGPVNISVHPASLAKHPRQWTKEEVGVWLRWCTEEYSIEPINPDKFDLNGKALCLLSRSDFLERLPKNGDVLYNCLQSLINKNSGGSLLYQHTVSLPTTSVVETTQLYKDPVTSFPSLTRGLIFVPSASARQNNLPYSNAGLPTRSYVPIKPYPTTQDAANRATTPITSVSPSDKAVIMENDEKPLIQGTVKSLEENDTAAPFKDFLRYPYQSVTHSSSPSFPDHKLENPRYQRSSDCRLLWEFVYQLLMNTDFSNYVCWENKDEYVFRIVNPTGLAELWGQQKNRTNMTYEKLSRALRYYYRMNIIKKVQGKRLTYRFLQPPSCIQKGQRGAKPHGRLQMNYGDISPSQNDPSLSVARCQDYDSDANSMTDQSLEDQEENHREVEGELISRGQGHGLENKTHSSVVKDSVSSSDHFTEHNLSHNRQNKETLLSDLNSYHADIPRLRVDRIPPVNPFHLTSSLFAQSEARYNLHYHGTETNGVSTIFRPNPMYPVQSRNNVPNFQSDMTNEEHFNAQIVPPAHTNNIVAHGIHDSLKRSHSYDFSTLQIPQFPKRPNQARSVSPRKDAQMEPEDLSMKRFCEKRMKMELHSDDEADQMNKAKDLTVDMDDHKTCLA